jgi:hypothetical protein
MKRIRRRKISPEKKALNKALREWRQRALLRAGHKCEWCGIGGKGLNVHHIISRRYKPLIVHDANSMVLCPRCHKFGVGLAAHENPIRVVEWLMSHRMRDYSQLVQHTVAMVEQDAKKRR